MQVPLRLLQDQNATAVPEPIPLSDSANTARTVVIIFFIGLGGLFGLVLLIYIVMVLTDLAAPPTELPPDQPPQSWTERVALSMSDRQRVLRAFFLSSTFVFKEEKNVEGGIKEIELGTTRSSTGSANETMEQEEILDAAASQSTSETSNNCSNTTGNPKFVQRSFSESQSFSEEMIDDAQHDSLCCICLEKYQPGEQILHSKHCAHQFHARCVQDWLLNRHECPYCRKEMIERDEWEETVAAVLGDPSSAAEAQPVVPPDVEDTTGASTLPRMQDGDAIETTSV